MVHHLVFEIFTFLYSKTAISGHICIPSCLKGSKAYTKDNFFGSRFSDMLSRDVKLDFRKSLTMMGRKRLSVIF